MKKLIILIVLFGIFLYIGCDKVSDPEFNIDKSSCNACGNCIQICPADAIEFNAEGKAVIDQTKCTSCGKCITICPKDAIH